MGVYIKGMKMPKGCVSCFLKYGSCSSIRKRIDESKVDKWCPVNYRHPDCPLIEVPDHGRLIDADAFFKDICNSIENITKLGIGVDAEFLWAKLNDALDNAPTVIPASKK